VLIEYPPARCGNPTRERIIAGSGNLNTVVGIRLRRSKSCLELS
jgi:hypothetical protein